MLVTFSLAKRGVRRYLFFDHCTESVEPDDAGPGDSEHEQTFAGEHGFGDTLVLDISLDTLGAREESVSTNTPRLLAAQTQ